MHSALPTVMVRVQGALTYGEGNIVSPEWEGGRDRKGGVSRFIPSPTDQLLHMNTHHTPKSVVFISTALDQSFQTNVRPSKE